MAKRNKSEGVIYYSGNRYRWQLYVGKKPDGSPKRVTLSDVDRDNLVRKVNAYIASVENDTYVEPDKITVGQLLEDWLYDYKKDTVSDKYFDSLEYHIKSYLIPAFGKIKLQKLEHLAIQKKYREWAEIGGVKKTPLSYKTIKDIHKTLKEALEYGIYIEKISKNPSINVKIPKKKPKVTAKMCYTMDEQMRLIDKLNLKESTDMLILTAIFCGLRKSELMALTWEDINLDKGFINVDKATSVVKDRNTNSDKNYKTIVKDPKSISSIRTVPIPKDLISKLHDYEKTMRLKNFKTHGKELLFPSMYNNFLDHNTVSKRLKSATEEADIPYLNFHKLRHTYITRLIENNMNIKVVQNLVGHSNSAITLDVYSHVTENASKVANEKISSIFHLKEDEDKYADLTDTSISFLLSHTNNSVNLSITPNNYN